MRPAAGSSLVRWVARAWSLASLLFVLAFAVGEGMNGRGAVPTAGELVALALWPVGVGIGLLVGWWREGPGGLMATGCLIAFYVWNLALHGRMPGGPWFILVAAPGILFLLLWLFSPGRSHR